MTVITVPSPGPSSLSSERTDLLEALTLHRQLLLLAADGLSEEAAVSKATVSELTIGGIIKHVVQVESNWAAFMVDGHLPNMAPDIDWSNPDPAALADYANGFRLLEGETLAGVIGDYTRVAAETDRLVATLADLNTSYPLPAAPWFPPNGTRSVRRTIVHIIAETAQHAGHADIIRETIDGSRSMG